MTIEITTRDYTVGDRVQAHPATDLWMQGVRWGTVTRLTKHFVYVRFDALGHTTMRCFPGNLVHDPH